MQYNKDLWSELQGPMHLNPQSAQNLRTFASADGDLSMADISQQTFAMSKLRAPGAERLPSPRRVDGALLRHEEADMQRAHHMDLSSQQAFGISEDWTVVPESAPPNPLAGCVETSELERLIRQQVGAGPHMAQAAQVLQNIQSQIGPFQADFLQQTMHEIAKRCAAPEALAGEWGAAAVAALANGNMQPPTVPGIGSMPEQFGAWSTWGQSPLGTPLAPSSCSGNLLHKGDDKTFDHAESGRIEELNQYIRQQSQEYMEGQAEWSRQIAEVKSECLRELEKVRRDKDEVERQARQEILRLSQRLRELGVKDEGAPGGDSPDSQRIGSWAKGVSFEEYQDVHRKWTSAEERIQQLEDYIKDQSSKQLLHVDGQGKDEEVQRLKQVVLTSSMELQQVAAESQAARMHYEQKLQCMEQGMRRLLNTGEQMLGQRIERSAEEERCHENGHFDRTATKLSLTLSQGKEGGSVGSLRRLLKDALTQSAPDSKNAKAQREKKSSSKLKTKDEDSRLPSAEEPALDEGKLDERGRIEDGIKSGEGESTPWSPSISVVGGAAALSDSNASSRETSPGRGVQMGGRNLLTLPCYSNGDSPLNASTASPFVSQVVNELRQLLASSQQLGAIGTSQTASLGTSPQASPRSASVGSSSSPEAKVDRGKVQDILDCVAPARKSIATHIITVEKMLRSLERDLRRYCEDLLGKAEFEVRLLSDSEGDAKGSENEEAMYNSAAEEEARKGVPLSADRQVVSLSALRRAQQRSSALLAQFVQLPQKLKTVFDLTKKLGIEVTSFVPQAALHQAEARAHRAHAVEQRQSFHVELLQKRIQTLTLKVAKLEGDVNCADQEGSGSEMDAEAAAKQIHEEIQRGISKDDQLLVACAKVRRLNRELAGQGTRVKTLEDEVVDLHLSRYNERAQCMALMAQSAGLPNPAAMAPWMFPPLGGMSDLADQAWSPGKPCPIPMPMVSTPPAWPPATCVR
mmetsp:Transcript_10449/g.17078  ORF Transcript_10449/g.17078 Transcript_10449/m.17078 type:complete len:974 (-) Transcript_10449:52-2973(-)